MLECYRSHTRHATVANAHGESSAVKVRRLETLSTTTYAVLILDVDIASEDVAARISLLLTHLTNQITVF